MTVRWTNAAANDLTNICDHTEQRFGVRQARTVALNIYGCVDSLRTMPFLGRGGRKPETRDLAIVGTPFVIIYRVKKESVEILRILHGKQQWP